MQQCCASTTAAATGGDAAAIACADSPARMLRWALLAGSGLAACKPALTSFAQVSYQLPTLGEDDRRSIIIGELEQKMPTAVAERVADHPAIKAMADQTLGIPGLLVEVIREMKLHDELPQLRWGRDLVKLPVRCHRLPASVVICHGDGLQECAIWVT